MSLKNEPLIIYGAGAAGRCILRMLRKANALPLAFLDSKQIDGQSSIDGVPLFHPDSREASKFKTGFTLVLGIFNTAVNSRELTASLHRRGFLQVVTFVQFIRKMEKEQGWDSDLGLQTYWLDKLSTLERLKREKLQLVSLFHDRESKSIVENLLLYRETGDDTVYPEANLSDQYFPQDIVPLKTRMPFSLFLDCGAFSGDTLIQLTKSASPSTILQLQEIISFEPDSQNYLLLAKTTRRLASAFGHISFRNFPCAVWSKTEIIDFQADGLGSSTVRHGGKVPVQAVSIDESVLGMRSTMTEEKSYLKMDLEGSEIQALHGASHFIRQNRPLLAISCYHTCDHLWEIPYLISSWNLGYRFFLRQHGQNGMDTVFYGIPE